MTYPSLYDEYDILDFIGNVEGRRMCDLLSGNVDLRIPCGSEDDVVREGMHKHKCGSCGTTWKHDNYLPQVVSDHENVAAHTCPGCGAEQWNKHGRWW